MNLLDKLKAWHSMPGSPGNTELKEMAQIGLRIIMGYIRQQRSPVSRTACSVTKQQKPAPPQYLVKVIAALR